MTRATLTEARWLMALLLAVLAGALLPGAASAQQTNIDARLVVEGPVQPGGETRIAIRFTPVSDEWHGYWSNPGDAGLGMEVAWDLPDGVTIGEFRYPAPERLLIGDLMNHIFEGEYAVVAPLRVAEGAYMRPSGPFW